MVVMLRHNIKWEENIHAFKEGMHTLVPGVQTTKPAKQYLIEYIENNVLGKYLSTIEPNVIIIVLLCTLRVEI